MNVLVTGATGFIGSHLLPLLVQSGDRVRALVRPDTDASALGLLGVEVVRGHICDAASLARAVAGCDLVFHLARSHRVAGGTMASVNIRGSAMLARAAVRAGVARLVHAGSASVYGFMPGSAVHEGASLRLDARYAWTKAMGERAVRTEAGDRMAVVVARITSVLGPGSLTWIKLFRSIGAGRVRLIGRADNRHHPADVSDIVDGLQRCAAVESAAGGIYNLAGPEALPLQTVVNMIAEELRVVVAPKRWPAAPCRMYLRLNRLAARLTGLDLPRAGAIGFLMTDRVLDISRARDELGYVPGVGVADAIRRTVGWYRKAGYLFD